MAMWDYRCQGCGSVTEDSAEDLSGRPCSCGELLKRVWSFFLAPVPGGGGSPGRQVGGPKRD